MEGETPGHRKEIMTLNTQIKKKTWIRESYDSKTSKLVPFTQGYQETGDFHRMWHNIAGSTTTLMDKDQRSSGKVTCHCTNTFSFKVC